MMVWVVHGVPRPVGLATLRGVCCAAPSYRVIALANCVME
jgi:hypothetical protein